MAADSLAAVGASAFTIGVGTMMNVDNPIRYCCSPTRQHRRRRGTGNPEGGWTLGQLGPGIPVEPASLPTALFVDVRELITAPQPAYDIWGPCSPAIRRRSR